MRRLVMILLPSLLVTLSAAYAKKVDVMPSTKHSALTLTTDESYGFQVRPGKPLKMDLVGPGSLSVSVRLNHKRKLPVLKGRFEIRRGRKRIKRASLKLHRSRVGAYKEDSSINPSIPKVFKIKVPRGVHSYNFSLRAARGTTMTVLFKYDTEADQSKARSEDDALALVPLVPPGGPEGGSDELALAPLAPIAPEEEKPKPKIAPRPKPEEKKPPKVAVVVPIKPAPKPEKKPPVITPIKLPKLPKEKKSARVIEIKPEGSEPEGITKVAPPKSAAIISVGLKGGQITPMQKVGTTTPTGALDLRYILPVFDGRLTLGVEGGFYQYKITIADEREVSLMVIPVALQLFYRIPLGTFLEPFVGLGGDVFICFGEDKRVVDGHVWNEGSGIAFGAHVSAGIEAALGPGFLVAEVRGGMSFGAAAVWEKANISGIATMVGYRFVF
jgi:hypothetical protein